MARRKRNYREGDVFAVPLRNGEYAIGIVARFSRGGIALGYFFGPRLEHLPQISEIKNLAPQNAVLIRLFGDLGLLNEEWPILGSIAGGNGCNWPIPKFCHPNGDDQQTYSLLTYNPKQLGNPVQVETISQEEANFYPEDGLSGYGAIEIRLTHLLPGQS